MMKTYTALPPGCRYAGTLDFNRNKEQIRAMLIVALILLFVPLIAGLVMVPPVLQHLKNPLWWGAVLGLQVFYIPLHELTHGIAMFLISGVRPTFGIKLPYAWCGSEVWFDRPSHILTALAPVLLWGAVFFVMAARLPRAWFWPVWLAQISNLSGSAGDIYCVWVILRMKGEVLIKDTGTTMRIVRMWV